MVGIVQDFRDESPLNDKKLKVYDSFFMVVYAFFVFKHPLFEECHMIVHG